MKETVTMVVIPLGAIQFSATHKRIDTFNQDYSENLEEHIKPQHYTVNNAGVTVANYINCFAINYIGHLIKPDSSPTALEIPWKVALTKQLPQNISSWLLLTTQYTRKQLYLAQFYLSSFPLLIHKWFTHRKPQKDNATPPPVCRNTSCRQTTKRKKN